MAHEQEIEMPDWIRNAGNSNTSDLGEDNSSPPDAHKHIASLLGEVNSSPPDAYEDVTSQYIHHLSASCTQHLVAPAAVLSHQYIGSVLAKSMYDGRIVCSEDAYNDRARMAFSPLMGRQFFPPWVTVPSSNSTTVELSCGGQELQLISHQDSFQRISTSNTCCPPERFSPQPPSSGNPTQRVAVERRSDIIACDRGLFGETQACKSKLSMKVLRCKSCSCQKNGELNWVDISTIHNLAENTASPGCHPWFSQVDAGLRSMLSDLRALVTAAKLEDCAPDMHPTATPINTTWNEHIGLKADLTPINEGAKKAPSAWFKPSPPVSPQKAAMQSGTRLGEADDLVVNLGEDANLNSSPQSLPICPSTAPTLSCEAPDAPEHGSMGNCLTDSDGRMSGSSFCQQACDSGYTITGVTSCYLGILHPARCLPSSSGDMVSILEWGENEMNCRGHSRASDIEQGKMCKTTIPELYHIKQGLDAEMLASFATGGEALNGGINNLSRTGQRLIVSASVLRRVAVTTAKLSPEGDLHNEMTVNLWERHPVGEAPFQSSIPQPELSFLGHPIKALDPKDWGQLMVLALNKAPSGAMYGAQSFAPLWQAAVWSTYKSVSNSLASDPAEYFQYRLASGKCRVPPMPDTFAQLANDTEWSGLKELLSTPDTPPSKFYDHFRSQMYKSIPLIGGLQFQVEGKTKLKLVQSNVAKMSHQLYMGCSSILEWDVNVCKACQCSQLVNSSITHQLIADAERCAPWFVRLDKLFHTYVGLIRGAVLAKKESCCRRDQWNAQYAYPVSIPAMDLTPTNFISTATCSNHCTHVDSSSVSEKDRCCMEVVNAQLPFYLPYQANSVCRGDKFSRDDN